MGWVRLHTRTRECRSIPRHAWTARHRWLNERSVRRYMQTEDGKHMLDIVRAWQQNPMIGSYSGVVLHEAR